MKQVLFLSGFVFLALVTTGCSGSTSSAICYAPDVDDETERFRAHMMHESGRGFSGSVLVAEGDSILFRQDYGDAAQSAGPTPFWIASISKPITAVAVLNLVEEGRLDLHAPISTYVAGVPQHWRDLTAHHLLGHRAGFPHAYSVDDIADREEALGTVLALEPIRPLGEFSYSNDGCNLLAILVEVVSGETFEDYAQSHVFVPAGMEHAGFWGLEPAPSPVAPAEDPARDPRGPDGRSEPRWGYRGSTGIFATPEDLHAFVIALQDGRLLEDETVEDMLTSKKPSVGPDAQTYGYGWALNLSGGNRVRYWHAGDESELGHNGLLVVEEGRVYVILSNSGEHGFGSGAPSWAQLIWEGFQACAGATHS